MKRLSIKPQWLFVLMYPALAGCPAALAQSLPAETEARLAALCADPRLADARVGLSVLALGRVAGTDSFPSQAGQVPAVSPKAPPGKALFERDAEKRFMPASNLKLFTAVLALKSLGADRRFRTRVQALGQVRNGVLAGDLLLHGSGDPSLDFPALDSLARQVRAAGIRRIEGGVYQAPPNSAGKRGLAENLAGLYPDGWTMDDANWYYGPEVTSLPVHRNQVDLRVTGGKKPGDAAVVSLEPGVPARLWNLAAPGRRPAPDPQLPTFITNIRTGAEGLARRSEEELVQVDRPIGYGQVVRVSGAVAPGQSITLGLAVPDAARWATFAFIRSLNQAGVTVSAGSRITPRQGAGSGSRNLQRIVAAHDSPPVGVLLRRFLKNSDNLYGELLLRLAARADLTVRGDSLHGANLARHGHEMLRSYLRSEGIDGDALRFSDGSGLSRYNLLTPRATAQLLAAAERLPGGQYFWDALPVAGVDGTLQGRMKGTAAQNNARAKTGTFSIVSSLSGYVTTRDGTRLAVSVLTNFARSGGEARAVQNEIFATLAEATLVYPERAAD